MSRPARALSSEFLDALVASGTSACAMRVALVLGRMQGNNDCAWPTIETIRAKVGCDTRSVQRAIVELREAGLITTEERRGKGTLYALLTPGESVTPDNTPTPGKTVTTTPGVDATPPPAFSSGAGDISVASHLLLSLKSDQGSLSREVQQPARSTIASSVVESVRKAADRGFRTTTKTPPPWFAHLTAGSWLEIAEYLDREFGPRAVELAETFGANFAKSARAESKGWAAWLVTGRNGSLPEFLGGARAEPNVDVLAIVARTPRSSLTPVADETGPIVLAFPKAARRSHA